jgi:putative spermidine/putrescine transport system permease protein
MLAPGLLIMLVFFLMPMLYLAFDSLHKFTLSTGSGGLTLTNYSRLLSDPYYLGVLGNTVRLAGISSVAALILGYPLALLLWQVPSRWKGLLVIAIIAPLLVSVIVRTFGWIVILGKEGLLNSAIRTVAAETQAGRNGHLFTDYAVVIGMVHVYIPFMVLSVYSALQKQQRRYVNAARNLGAGTFRAFLHVTFPLSVPGIVTGMTTVFAMAAGSYVTVAVLGGSRVMVMSILAYQQAVGLANWQFGAAISIVLLVGTLVIIQVVQSTLARTLPHVYTS